MALIISIGYLMSAMKTRHVLCKYCYAKKYAKMATTKFQFAYHLLFRSLTDIHSFFSVLLCVLSSVRPSAINSFVRASVCSFFRSFRRSFVRSFVSTFLLSFVSFLLLFVVGSFVLWFVLSLIWSTDRPLFGAVR